MKKRISIYIDEVVWDDLKERAWESRKSASSYLEGLITGYVRDWVNPTPIREKVKCKGNIQSDDEVLAKAQKKLDAIKSEVPFKSFPKKSWGGTK